VKGKNFVDTNFPGFLPLKMPWSGDDMVSFLKEKKKDFWVIIQITFGYKFISKT